MPNSGCTSPTNSKQDHSSEASSQKISMNERDDDSPYFLKIIFDETFLSYLEEPSLVNTEEISHNTQVLIENRIFLEIIQKEVRQMFGARQSPKKESRSNS